MYLKGVLFWAEMLDRQAGRQVSALSILKNKRIFENFLDYFPYLPPSNGLKEMRFIMHHPTKI